jgi:DNA invertase Pin-like site-specific DNA recombinase
MRIAVYCRVSKSDESQDPINQLNPLRDYAKAIGGEIIQEYVDMASGSNGDRKEFLKMLEDADKRKFDLLLVWALDRLSREGISNTLGYIQRLKKDGIALKSLQESWVDTNDGPGEVMVAVLAWVAQQERKRIIERTKAGLEKARKSGKVLGRPLGKKDSKQRRKSGYYLRYHQEKNH